MIYSKTLSYLERRLRAGGSTCLRPSFQYIVGGDFWVSTIRRAEVSCDVITILLTSGIPLAVNFGVLRETLRVPSLTSFSRSLLSDPRSGVCYRRAAVGKLMVQCL